MRKHTTAISTESSASKILLLWPQLELKTSGAVLLNNVDAYKWLSIFISFFFFLFSKADKPRQELLKGAFCL